MAFLNMLTCSCDSTCDPVQCSCGCYVCKKDGAVLMMRDNYLKTIGSSYDESVHQQSIDDFALNLDHCLTRIAEQITELQMSGQNYTLYDGDLSTAGAVLSAPVGNLTFKLVNTSGTVSERLCANSGTIIADVKKVSQYDGGGLDSSSGNGLDNHSFTTTEFVLDAEIYKTSNEWNRTEIRQQDPVSGEWFIHVVGCFVSNNAQRCTIFVQAIRANPDFTPDADRGLYSFVTTQGPTINWIHDGSIYSFWTSGIFTSGFSLNAGARIFLADYTKVEPMSMYQGTPLRTKGTITDGNGVYKAHIMLELGQEIYLLSSEGNTKSVSAGDLLCFHSTLVLFE